LRYCIFGGNHDITTILCKKKFKSLKHDLTARWKIVDLSFSSKLQNQLEHPSRTQEFPQPTSHVSLAAMRHSRAWIGAG
jgi:hypothetical protein